MRTLSGKARKESKAERAKRQDANREAQEACYALLPFVGGGLVGQDAVH